MSKLHYFINELDPCLVGTTNPGTEDIVTLCRAESPDYATLICEALNARGASLDPEPSILRDIMADAAGLLSDLAARHDTATDWEDEPGTIVITAGGVDFTFAVHQPCDYWKDHGFHYAYGPSEDPEDPVLGDYALDLTHSPAELADWIRRRLIEEGVIEATA